MKSLKNLFAYNHLILVVLIILLNFYFKNILCLLFSVLYLILSKKNNDLIITIFVLLMMFLSINLKQIKLPYFLVVSNINNNITVTNGLYRVKINKVADYLIGDIIKINQNELKNTQENSPNAKNIYYTYHSKIHKLTSLSCLRRFLNFRINAISNNKIKALMYKIVLQLNDYQNIDNHLMQISMSFYFFLNFLEAFIEYFTDNQKIKYGLLFFISFVLFGLNMAYLRSVLFKLFKLSKSKERSYAFPVIILLIINPNIIYSVGFLFSITLRLVFLFNSKIEFKAVLIGLEAYFFNQVNLIKILFYRSYISIYLVTYFLSLISIMANLNVLNIIYLFVNIIEKIDTVQIKGHLNIFVILYGLYFIKQFKIKSGLQTFIILLLILSNLSNIYGSVNFIDVGQGDAILIRAPFNKENILIDTGPKFSYYKLKRSLDYFGVYQIDKIVITHSDEDHIGNLINLSNDYLVKEIVYTHHDFDTKVGTFHSLNKANFNNPNDNSLVHYLNYLGKIKFMFTGDISQKIESKIIDENPNLKIDVLKLSHHGSKTGSCLRFLYYLQPYYGIASTNGKYGHPHQEVADNLDKMNIKMLTTYENGNISFIFTNLFKFIKCSNGRFVIIKE